MKLHISEYSQLSVADQTKITKQLFSEHDQVVSIGDYLVSDSYLRIERVLDMKFVEEMVWAKPNDTADREKVPEQILYIYYQRMKTWEGEFEDTQKRKASDCFGSSLGIWKGTLEELKNQAELLIKTPDPDEEEEEEQSEGLATLDSGGFIAKKKSIILKKNEMVSVSNTARGLMEEKVSQLRAKVSLMQKEVEKLSEIIWTLELYLGLKEDICLIKKGKPASNKEPIKLLQERLYMDEEVGDPTNGGVDFRNIDKFIEWLLSYSDYFGHPNFELLVPHQKCVRILRVRREAKRYSDNPWINASLNKANFETFILIRNGDSLYYIATDMQFSDKLFPAQDDLMDVYNRIKDSQGVQSASEKVEDVVGMYKRNLIIMQGLIDRTEVFGDLYGKVNFLNGTSINSGEVELIYDCDKSNQISDGDLLFSDWLSKSNKEITKGSRILYIPSYKYNGDYASCLHICQLMRCMGRDIILTREKITYPLEYSLRIMMRI